MDYKRLGIRIRQMRHSKGITQSVLAEKAGISASFLGHIERGSRVASLDTLVKIANTLECGLDALLTDSLDASRILEESKLDPQRQKVISEILAVIEKSFRK